MTYGTHHEPLARYALKLGDRVAVELLVAARDDTRPGGRLVEGRVADATSAILLLKHDDGTAICIPWAAIALIRDAHPAHPAL